jgi:hypothetical protein
MDAPENVEREPEVSVTDGPPPDISPTDMPATEIPPPAEAPTDSPEIDFEYVPMGRQGKVQMALHVGSANFTDKFDVTDAEGREKFIKKVLEQYPALNAGDLNAELIKIGGEIADRNLHRDDDKVSSDGEEGDEFGDGGDAGVLVEIVKRDGVELLHAGSRHDAEGFATIQIDNHKETWPIKSIGFGHWLRQRFYELTERAPIAQAFTDAINLLSSIAIFEGKETQVFVRLAEHEGDIWLDLGDEHWRAVQITKRGWDVIDGSKVPVKFVRRRGMLGLPVPVPGGTVDELRRFVNMPTDDLWFLYAGSLISLFRPRGPFIVMVFTGQQGSAKSSSARKTRALVDPNKAPLRRLTRDDRDLMIAANNAFVLAFDNLSHIPPSISDALCSLATGGGFGTRLLYSDDEEKLFDSMRPVILNGIEDIATRADLLDRAVLFNLPAMDEGRLREEADLERDFEEARPRILGALLDAACEALRRIDSVQLKRKPRMVDFAKWCTAGETAFGWKPGTFLDAYMRNRGDATSIAMESSAIGPALLECMENVPERTGTHGELLRLLADHYTNLNTRERKDWPKTPKGFSDALRRLIPTLHALGIQVVVGTREPGGKRERMVTLRRVAPTPSGDGRGDAAGQSEADNRPGKSGSGDTAEAVRDGWDGRDVRVPTSPKTASNPSDGGAGVTGNPQPDGQAQHSTEEVGTEPSQSSQPSRNGPGDPQEADSPGRSRDSSTADGTVERPEPDAVIEPVDPPRRRAKQAEFIEDPGEWEH